MVKKSLINPEPLEDTINIDYIYETKTRKFLSFNIKFNKRKFSNFILYWKNVFTLFLIYLKMFYVILKTNYYKLKIFLIKKHIKNLKEVIKHE
jgi:hypothetical protein